MHKNKTLSEYPVIGDKIEIKRVNIEADDKYASQVLDIIDDDIYIISGPIQKSTLIPLHVGNLIEISYFREDKGRFVFKAKIIEREYKDVYKLKIERISCITKIQERNYYRLSVKLDVQKVYSLKIRDEEKEVIENCTAKDISGSGIRMFCNLKHSIGDLVKLQMPIGDFNITALGTVVRVQEIENGNFKFSLGVKFTDIKDEDRERLIKYIFEQQRKLRKKGLI
ncbi:flagellar brake protein [Caloranaerobacter azorensis]|uniref:Flagellar brake protein n=1 Tax=Caloranaerobacter azorensis TaxID=116090 RepID=A0A6P1YDC0_9FIRM|nr:flagellar brake protein [Caloranaerobacter azorensis]QIB26175.1 flagellar brake protein [Caloranaerobacter azorensis]